MCPQAGHLFRDVTSFNAFPAICLDLFLEWDVFFFGTAFSIDSHSPSNNPGTLSCIAEGIAKCSDGITGRESCRECRMVDLDAKETAGRDNRGRKEERIEDVVTCLAAIALIDRSWDSVTGEGGSNCDLAMIST